MPFEKYVLACFQAQNQDAFDWQLAQVPTNDILTPEEEARIANKKKEKRKAQKQVQTLTRF